MAQAVGHRIHAILWQAVAFGELWYAEADAPTGPGACDQDIKPQELHVLQPADPFGNDTVGFAILLFEGTFTREFSNNKEPVPRYDYNQIMYRLDLDQESLKATHK